MSKLVEAARNALVAMRKHRKPSNEYDFVHVIIELEDALLADHIGKCAHVGLVAVVESGRDCDGVEYHGYVRIIEASLEAYNRLHDDIAHHADGPFRLEIVSPAQAVGIRYTSRDLVAEAHEDGHPHSITSEFP